MDHIPFRTYLVCNKNVKVHGPSMYLLINYYPENDINGSSVGMTLAVGESEYLHL